MHYWLITDTHFNHEGLGVWGARPSGWQGRLWNGLARVPADDVLIHLGDVCNGNDEAVHARLMSFSARRKILVLGNHCTQTISWYIETGWSFACDSFEMSYEGHRILFTHRPQPPTERITLNIHGHTHGTAHRGEEHDAFYRPGYHVDISPELMGYDPVRLDMLIPATSSNELPRTTTKRS